MDQTLTARLEADAIVISHGQEDSDFFLLPDGSKRWTILDLTPSEEWEPETYDALLASAGWKRTSPWAADEISAVDQATVEPA